MYHTISKNQNFLNKKHKNGTTVSLTNQLIIADNFAKNFINLSTINTLDEITSLGKYAFSATAITSFTLPKNITTLPDYCLNNCIQLKTLTLNDVCQHIGNYAVGNCGSLKEIVWNDTVSSIDNNSFEYYTSLKRAILPKSMIHLGSEVKSLSKLNSYQQIFSFILCCLSLKLILSVL